MIVKPKEIKFLGYLCVVVHYELYRLTIHDLSVISYYILHVSITRISHLTGTVLSFWLLIDDHGTENLSAIITKQAQINYSHQSTLNGSLTLGPSSYEYLSLCRGVKAIAKLLTMNSVLLVELCILLSHAHCSREGKNRSSSNSCRKNIINSPYCSKEMDWSQREIKKWNRACKKPRTVV